MAREDTAGNRRQANPARFERAAGRGAGRSRGRTPGAHPSRREGGRPVRVVYSRGGWINVNNLADLVDASSI